MAAEHPNKAAQPTKLHPLAQAGITTGFGTIVGSVLVGALAYTAGRKDIYKSLFKARMIIIATTIGFYTTATGMWPPPEFFTKMVGRQPRQASLTQTTFIQPPQQPQPRVFGEKD